MTRLSRRVHSVILSALIFCAVFSGISLPASAETAKLSGNFTYIHNDTGLTIVKVKAVETVEIPSDIDGETVTAVQSDAFKQTGAVNIVIPATVTDLGDGNVKSPNSLFSSSVESITVDQGNPVYSSSDGALFRDSASTLVFWPRAKSGSAIQIPETITRVAPYAFAGNKNITSVTFVGQNTEISDGAFYGCSGLETIAFPAALTTIGEQAFKNCTSLTAVTLPSTVTQIGSQAFSGCSRLTTISSAAALSDDALAALSGSSKTLTVYLPDGRVYKSDSKGALSLSSAAPVMPAYEETTAVTTAAEITTPPAESTTEEETTTEETSADTTEDVTVTIAPPDPVVDPSIGVEQTESPNFEETTEKEPVTERTTESESEPAAVVSETETGPDGSQPYETVYFVEPKPTVFERISADLTLVWILGGVAVACAVAAAVYLLVTKIRATGYVRPRQARKKIEDGERHSKYYDR